MPELNPTVLLYSLRDEVDVYMRDLITRKISHQQEILFYSLGWLDKELKPLTVFTGKRVRPALCLLTHEAITGERRAAIPLAAAIELFHTFTLVHDDIMDRDLERRGIPTVWTIWSDALAITAGDTLVNLAYVALRDLQAPSAETLLKINAGLAETGVLLGAGQHMDVVFERNPSVTPQTYLEMIAGKTVALIEYAVYAGALLASEDPAIVGQMREFGKNLGYAFQIRDDYLNIWSGSYQSQKTAYGDLLRKKKTLPIICAFDNADALTRAALAEIYADADSPMTAEQQAYVIDVLERYQVKELVREQVDGYITDALACLNAASLSASSSKDQLFALTDYLLKREI